MYIPALPDNMSASNVIAKTCRLLDVCVCMLRIWLVTYLWVRQSKGDADTRHVITAVLGWSDQCQLATCSLYWILYVPPCAPINVSITPPSPNLLENIAFLFLPSPLSLALSHTHTHTRLLFMNAIHRRSTVDTWCMSEGIVCVCVCVEKHSYITTLWLSVVELVLSLLDLWRLLMYVTVYKRCFPSCNWWVNKNSFVCVCVCVEGCYFIICLAPSLH